MQNIEAGIVENNNLDLGIMILKISLGIEEI